MTVLNNFLKLTFQAGNPSPHHTLVQFKLGLAGIPLGRSTTSLTAEVCPRTLEARHIVLHSGEFNL
jgi:hypothetical protein